MQPSLKTISLLSAILLLSGCQAMMYKPFAANEHNISDREYAMAGCQAEAGHTTQASANVGGGIVVGAILGALLGRAAGLNGRLTTQVAAYGAVNGAVQGAVLTVEQQSATIANCMAAKGF